MRKRITIYLSALFIFGALFTLGTTSAYADVPDSISFQGILKTATGSTVPDGSYSVTFKIYDAATGGSLLWTEVQSVSTVSGLFTTLLGRTTPLSASVFSSPKRFLGIKVSSDPEMSPRLPLVSSPYGYRIATVDKASGGLINSDLYTVGSSGMMTFYLDVQESTQGSVMRFYDAAGDENVFIDAEQADGGGAIGLRNSNGILTAAVDAEYGATGSGSAFILYNKTTGSRVIRIQAEYPNPGDPGRIITPVLEITGGADLSEQFNVGSTDGAVPHPGMVVCIDPKVAGGLVVSTSAYDLTVAGIISGAGDVSPGMLMGHQGSIADGNHPIALSGRVYCMVDATHGAIAPGDFLTTSDTPGHAMKATDRERGNGAIIGKAMTGLESGRGLVLVLVNLQ